MNTDNWIKRTDRSPTEADCPIMIGWFTDGKWWANVSMRRPCKFPFTHWKPLTPDLVAPPQREITLREKDVHWVESNSWPHLSREGAILEAIYAERREFKALLSQWFKGEDWGQRDTTSPVAKQLRARCDEQG